MKLFKALKKIAKNKGELLEIQRRISSNISTLEGNEFEESFEELMKEYNQKVSALVSLKNKVMATNIQNGQYETILKIGELKSKIEFLRGLGIKRGAMDEGYGYNQAAQAKYVAQWSDKERNAKIRELQGRIETFTETLDDFNAVTDVVNNKVACLDDADVVEDK